MGEFSRIWKGDLTDGQLGALWEMFRACGRDRAVMFGMPPMDGAAFALWLRQNDIAAWALTFRGSPAGLFFLEKRRGKTADMHFAMLPMGTARLDTPAGRLSAALCAGLCMTGAALWERNVSGGFILDTLVGVIPSCLGPALKLAAKGGARFHAAVPGACWCWETGENVPGVVFTMTRAEIPEWTAGL